MKRICQVGRRVRFRPVVVSARGDEPAPTSEFVTPPDGLDDAAVRERVDRGQVNASGERTSRTLPEIIRANVVTRFNAILGSMLVLILVFGHPADGLFGIVLVANSLIGIVQEIRAKRTLDRLAVLNTPIARVVRSGTAREVAIEAVVLDDLVELRTGDQVCADGLVRAGNGLEIDESLLTGEAEPVNKGLGVEVLSGSFVVAGSGRFQATRVGSDSYARRLAHEARRFSLTRSELVEGINKILVYVTWAILVVGPLLFWSQLQSTNASLSQAITAAVAGVVGMVPEGLVLLTSLAFGVAAVTLARRQVLVQELPAVEGLARVDVVCLDKTGTLTEGSVVFDSIEVLEGADEATVDAALAALGDDEQRERDSRRDLHRVPDRRVHRGRVLERCRSPRRASGARPNSTVTAVGSSGHPRWSGSMPPRRRGSGPTSWPKGESGCCCSRTPTAV